MPVYKNEKNNSYYIRIYVKDENGKTIQIKKRNKEWIGREGKILAQQEEIRIKNGFSKTNKNPNTNESKTETPNITINTLIELYKKEHEKYNKESTLYGVVSIIKNQIAPYLGECDVFSLTVDDINNWKTNLDSKKYSLRYKKDVYKKLVAIIEIAIKSFGLTSNVARISGTFKTEKDEKEKIISSKGKLKYMPLDDFKRFISFVDKDDFFVYFNLLYFTGMRRGEVQALTWNDIDFTNNRIIVNKTLSVKSFEQKWKITSTKNLKNRTIGIDNNLKNILFEYFQKKKKDPTFSHNHFVLGNDQPIKQHKIDDNKEKYFKRSGISPITNHEFRHSHVSLMINEYLKTGQTDTTKFFIMMSNRLGHTIKVMQETYLHLFPDVQTPIVDLINNLTTNL